jgi:hypothetical protein
MYDHMELYQYFENIWWWMRFLLKFVKRTCNKKAGFWKLAIKILTRKICQQVCCAWCVCMCGCPYSFLFLTMYMWVSLWTFCSWRSEACISLTIPSSNIFLQNSHQVYAYKRNTEDRNNSASLQSEFLDRTRTIWNKMSTVIQILTINEVYNQWSNDMVGKNMQPFFTKERAFPMTR